MRFAIFFARCWLVVVVVWHGKICRLPIYIYICFAPCLIMYLCWLYRAYCLSIYIWRSLKSCCTYVEHKIAAAAAKCCGSYAIGFLPPSCLCCCCCFAYAVQNGALLCALSLSNAISARFRFALLTLIRCLYR